MAFLVNRANGNWTSASTWAVIEASSWTAALATQETGTTALTAAFQASPNFTVPTTQTLQGILLKVQSRVLTAGNTVTARIFNVTGAAAVANTTVTVDVLDMPNGIGWVFFKFPANATLNTATNYQVQITANVANAATFYRKSATAAAWTFGLVTTTQQAPAAADQIVITGENSSIGAYQTLTVTMNNTSATVFGPNTAGQAAIEVSAKGVLSYTTAASTASLLTLAGNIFVNSGAVWQIGTSSAPIPAGSTAQLTFSLTANVQYGIQIRDSGTFTTYGAAKTSKTFLSAPENPGDTTLLTTDATGWLAGDLLAVSTTGRNAIAQSEAVSMTANAVGTNVPITALTNFHDGSASATAARALVINVSRNVKIAGTSATFQTYLNTPATTATVSLNNTQFQFFGSATAGTRGIDVNQVAGLFEMNGCACTNFEVALAMVNIAVATAVATFNDCVFYRIAGAAINQNVNLTTNTVTVNNCAAIGGTSMGTVALFNFNCNSGTYTNLYAYGGPNLGIAILSTATAPALTTNNWTVACCTGANITVNLISENTNSAALLDTLMSYRSAAEGVLLGSATTGACINTTIANARIFGNATRGLTAGFVFSSVIKSSLIYNETGYDQPIGLAFNNHIENLYVDDCQLGITLAHSNSDVRDVCPRNEHNATFRNCLFGSVTELSNQSLFTPGSAVGSARHDQTAGVQKMWKKYGLITLDNSFYKVQAPSQRLTPSDSSNKLLSQEKRIAVPSGQAATISVWVRKSVIGDGTAYSGNEIQIIALRDPAIGIFSDTVLATSSSLAFGDFEKITGTTPTLTDNGVVRIVATCDGIAGWVNVDLWTVAIS